MYDAYTHNWHSLIFPLSAISLKKLQTSFAFPFDLPFFFFVPFGAADKTSDPRDRSPNWVDSSDGVCSSESCEIDSSERDG